jgi:hypothetical protein
VTGHARPYSLEVGAQPPDDGSGREARPPDPEAGPSWADIEPAGAWGADVAEATGPDAGWTDADLAPDAGWTDADLAPDAGWTDADLAPNAAWTDPPLPAALPHGGLPPSRPRRRLAAAVAAGVIVLAGCGAAIYALAGDHRHRATSTASAPTTTAPEPSSASTIAAGSAPAATPPSGPPTTSTTRAATPPTLAVREARTLSAALVESAASRTRVASAVTEIASCGNLASARITLTAATDDRRNLVTQIRRGAFNRIPNAGPALRQLTAAAQASAASDRSYAGWAADERINCTPDDTSDPNFRRAQSTDGAANAAKEAFVAAWNPIASEYGLPAWTADRI